MESIGDVGGVLVGVGRFQDLQVLEIFFRKAEFLWNGEGEGKA